MPGHELSTRAWLATFVGLRVADPGRRPSPWHLCIKAFEPTASECSPSLEIYGCLVLCTAQTRAAAFNSAARACAWLSEPSQTSNAALRNTSAPDALSPRSMRIPRKMHSF